MMEENGRTPLYEALQRSRYQRQDQIREIEEATGRRLIVYFANWGHPGNNIQQTDVAPFQDLLSDCEKGADLDLLLQSPGGDADTAEKLIFMLRHRAGSLRVVVTERAKSAATLMALGADEIVMGTTSELGPIDPQILLPTPDGSFRSMPAQSFLDGLKNIMDDIPDGGTLNPVYFPLLQGLDPALLDFCKKAISRAQQIARKWLTKYMLAGDKVRAAEIAKALTDVQKYSSHGTMINYQEAEALGLEVRFHELDSSEWRLFWKLHLAYEVEVRSRSFAKVFESRRVSVPLQ